MTIPNKTRLLTTAHMCGLTSPCFPTTRDKLKLINLTGIKSLIYEFDHLCQVRLTSSSKRKFTHHSFFDKKQNDDKSDGWLPSRAFIHLNYQLLKILEIYSIFTAATSLRKYLVKGLMNHLLVPSRVKPPQVSSDQKPDYLL